MDEADFWVSLERRLCREFAGMADPGLRHLWCDGLIPHRYHLGDAEPRIAGRAWICPGQEPEVWRFTLFFPRPVGSREEIDWAALFPPENATDWLAIDQEERVIEIEPGTALPDAPPRDVTPGRLPDTAARG